MEYLTDAAYNIILRQMSNHRNTDLDRLSEVFGALSNPNRLNIFMRLISCCGPGVSWTEDSSSSACVGELGQDMGLAPSTVSHHVRELRRAGLIQMQRNGQKVECWIDGETLGDLAQFFTRCCGAGSLEQILEDRTSRGT